MSKNHTKKSRKNWVIAIPSYKRAETLRDKTITTLLKCKIPPHKINIFVANKDEYDIYKNVLLDGTYNKIIIGKPGLANVRNFISDYFPIGTKLVNIDDDITDFIEYSKYSKRNEKKVIDLNPIIEKGFYECFKNGCKLWGIYPVANGFFMKPTITTKLTYIIGCFWGCINPGSKQININLDDKEDYLRSILYYKTDGCVIRLNYIAPKTNYYKEPGGMQEERTMKRIKDSAIYISTHYPEYATYYDKKKSGYPELKLHDHRDYNA